MTQEQKDLLIKDLGCRLLYGVKVHAQYTNLEETIEVDGIVKMIDADGIVGIEVIYDTSSAWAYVQIDDVKPYLFPLSSMTEEQLLELASISFENSIDSSIKTLDWLNKNHFDYRGLIEKGLAIDCTNLNIY